jgi:hypothetical protein
MPVLGTTARIPLTAFYAETEQQPLENNSVGDDIGIGLAAGSSTYITSTIVSGTSTDDGALAEHVLPISFIQDGPLDVTVNAKWAVDGVAASDGSYVYVGVSKVLANGEAESIVMSPDFGTGYEITNTSASYVFSADETTLGPGDVILISLHLAPSMSGAGSGYVAVGSVTVSQPD